jgi:hypothetical protein
MRKGSGLLLSLVLPLTLGHHGRNTWVHGHALIHGEEIRGHHSHHGRHPGHAVGHHAEGSGSLLCSLLLGGCEVKRQSVGFFFGGTVLSRHL